MVQRWEPDVSGAIYVGKYGMLDVDGTPEPATRTEEKNYFIQKMIWVKENKRTGHIGQFIDIGRGGGHEVFEAWKKIQRFVEKEEIEEYNRFKSVYSKNNHKFSGYSDYLNSIN